MTNDIGKWLQHHGLGRYIDTFVENEIDRDALPYLTEDDLKEMGVALGPRRKLLAAIAALAAASEPALSDEDTESISSTNEAERRQLTVLFVDLVGSTALSGQLDPEEMREALTSYQNLVASVVTRFDGHIAKYMGDGVLCYFGWPRAHEDDAERAVRTAMTATQSLRGITAPNGQVLSARAGIATGLVVVGDLIGEGAAQEEAVVGETPNLAARMQGLAKPNQVIVTDLTRQLLGDLFELADLGGHELKGISGSTSAYAVIAERVVESRFEARSSGSVSEMVGRDHELALMLERWRQASKGEGQLLLLTGEAGIGKSRITQAMIDAVKREPHVRISYQCSPYHADSSLYPAIQQLTFAAGIKDTDSNDEKLDKLEAVLLNDSVVLITALMGLEAQDRYGPLDLTPQQQRTRTLQALVNELIALSRDKPVLLILEDAHWIDASTLEFLDLCLDQVASAPVLMLITARPTFEYGFGGHPIVTKLALNRLGRDQVTAIVDKITGGKVIPAELLEEIAAKTDGVPLFVEELTKTVLESSELRELDTAYELKGPLSRLAIPATLHDSLMARLDRLQPIKEVAQTAACIGRQFEYPLIESISPLDGMALQDALEQLVGAELVFRRGMGPEAIYTFKHALVRDAAYESLLKSRRQTLHLAIANALNENFSETVESGPELLAHHYTEAGLTELAIDYWQKAGERALRRSANVEAINHLMKGLDLIKSLPDGRERALRELPLQLALGPALMATKGQGASEARQAYARARELGQRTGDTGQHFQALWGSWRSYFIQSEHGKARELGEECLGLAETSQDIAFILAARFALGGTLVFRGEFAAARVHIEQAVPLYDIEKHRSLRFQYGQDPGASSLSYLGWTLWFLGFPERAIEKGRKALALAEALAHPFTLAQVRMYLAITHTFCRDWCAAQSSAEATIRLSEEQGFPQTLWLCSSIHARALVEEGQLETGIPLLEESVAARKAIGVAAARMFELALLAEAFGGADRNDKGLEVLAEALEFANNTGEGFYLPEVHRLKGELLLQQHNLDAAEEAAKCFRQALDAARRQQSKSLELRTAISLARLWRQQGKVAKASNLLVPVYGWFTEGFDMPDLQDAKALLDELS